MNCKKVKLFSTVLFILILASQAFPHWLANKSDVGFASPTVNGASMWLENYVIEGAGYFLDSYANMLLFMKKLELSGKDSAAVVEAALPLNNALKSIEMANRTFLELKRLADITPYNTAVTNTLCQFDYDKFRADYNIDDRMFDRAQNYLVKGDIRSVYHNIVVDSEMIIKRLKLLKTQVDIGVFPATWDVWNLDRAYSDLERFGQYVARVFDALEATN